MRRALLLAVAATVAAVVVFFLARPARSPADSGQAKKTEAPAGAEQLPVGRVVLFSSGVGYFQREGTVEGDARVDLAFPASDVNDLLKSMVLRDQDGGRVAAVSYDSAAPLERTLKSFAVDLTANPSFAQLLQQARGEKVEVALSQAAAGQPAALTGTIVGTEKKQQATDKGPIEQELLNLWCADGLRSVKLADVQRVRLLNPALDAEFRKALEALAGAHDAQKKAVSLLFSGKGKRRVSVAYVVESPIWKTSYRLVLGRGEDQKPYLQGWAVVENPSDEDWRGVRMALVSGRPVSFRMDLYQPLYVPRPLVEPELFASLRPVAYSGAMGGNKEEREVEEEVEQLERKAGAITKARQSAARSVADEEYQAAVRDLNRAKQKLDMLRGNRARKLVEAKALAPGEADKDLSRTDLGRSVATAASAARLGDYFQYAIGHPVTLPRQKSALLPIVGKDVQASRVSIYNERTQPKFPLLGLRFKNTSGLHLMQGPVTVFEGSNYAGDARIMDLQPGEERLLSYAVDLGTEVNPVPSAEDGRLTHVKAVKGLLYTTTKFREKKTYAVKNRNEQERTVLIEHPVRHDFRLVETAKPAETASDFYRFELRVPPGKSASLAVTEERDVGSTVALTNSPDEQIRIFLNSKVVSDRVKEGLRKAQGLRWELAKTQREIGELQRQLGTITQDQARLRANLKEMPATAAAYKRYLEKFDSQETEIERYQADVKKLQAQEHQQRKALDDFLASFSAE